MKIKLTIFLISVGLTHIKASKTEKFDQTQAKEVKGEVKLLSRKNLTTNRNNELEEISKLHLNLSGQGENFTSEIGEKSTSEDLEKRSFSGLLGPCQPLVVCASFYDELDANNSFCILEPNVFGARCRTPQEAKMVRRIPLMNFPTLRSTISYSAMDLENVIGNSISAFEERQNMEKELRRLGLVVDNPNTPEFGHLQLFLTMPKAKEKSNLAFVQEIAIHSIKDSLNSNWNAKVSKSASNASKIEVGKLINCHPNITCNLRDLLYRRYDGSCNNLDTPSWGQTFTTLERITPTNYDDGISVPRKSVTGKQLPSARKISSFISFDIDKPSHTHTLSVMQWGQIIAHDLTHAPISRFDNKTGILCCGKDGLPLSPSLTHPECLPIIIPKNDYFYSKYGQQCMNFVRSLPVPNINCQLGPRNQMNQLSHYLDGSTIYGSSKTQADKLRAFRDGLLNVQPFGFLPEDPATNMTDFLSGDSRTNEQPQLIVIHTILAREHNRVAGELLNLKPFWNDEAIYQEARKIVAAELQHITYNEWLPIILGTETMEKHNLLPKKTGFITSYDKTLNPNIINEFAVSAFRFGHTLIDGNLKLYGTARIEEEVLELRNTFQRENVITEIQRFNKLLRGLYKQPMQEFDSCISYDVTNHLSRTKSFDFGLDLIAFNIQRARDHGIGTYNDVLEACQLPRMKTFQDLKKIFRKESARVIPHIYESVEDIDPFIAGISELSIQGGILGPTFNCLVREQFSRLKFGDRFFYENGGLKSSFTEVQLREIRKTSWARLICDNGQNSITSIQPLAFRMPDSKNVMVPCSSIAIPKVNLNVWFQGI